jgi:FkbM family methyltransferase
MIGSTLKSIGSIFQYAKHRLLVTFARFFPSLCTRNDSTPEAISEVVHEPEPEPEVMAEPEVAAEPEVVVEVVPEPQWRSVLDGPLQGYELLIDLTSVPHWYQEMWEGSYDAFLYEALGDPMPLQGATVWDVGSHIGYHALTFAALVGPSGRVVAFEPNPYNVEQIRNHLERNDELASRITLLDCALGDVDGEDNFIFSPEIRNGYSSGSHLERAHAPNTVASYEAKSFNQRKVLIVRGDTLLREQQVPPPSLIKLDVEGAESLILAGAKQLLTNHKPTLLIEVHHILAMYEILHILLPLDYQTRLIQQAPTSTSRCFMVARPNMTQ